MRRALFGSVGSLVAAGVLTGCPSTVPPRADRPLHIVAVDRHARPATIMETAIWSRLDGPVEVTMDVLRVHVEIGGPPPAFLVVTLYDQSNGEHYSRRFEDVRLGRQTLEVELIDPRGHRPPPGIYRLVIVPYARNGMPSGGDEQGVRLVDERA